MKYECPGGGFVTEWSYDFGAWVLNSGYYDRRRQSFADMMEAVTTHVQQIRQSEPVENQAVWDAINFRFGWDDKDKIVHPWQAKCMWMWFTQLARGDEATWCRLLRGLLKMYPRDDPVFVRLWDMSPFKDGIPVVIWAHRHGGKIRSCEDDLLPKLLQAAGVELPDQPTEYLASVPPAAIERCMIAPVTEWSGDK